MKPSGPTTGDIYTSYDAVIKLIEQWVDAKNPRIEGCNSSDVKARIVQRIVELTNEEYTRYSVERLNNSSQSRALESDEIIGGGLSVCPGTGRTKVSPGLYVSSICLFLVSWSHIFVHLLAALFRRCPANSSATTLLMEGGGYDDDDTRFVKFCRQGPILPLTTANNVIVKSKKPPGIKTDSRICYSAHPVIYLVSNYLSRTTRLALFLRHMGAPLVYLYALFNCPLNVLVSRDLSVVPIVRSLDDKDLLEAILLTTSAFASQFLWMKGLINQKFKLHMLWYSQNFVPKTYVGEKQSSNLPAARLMRIDTHWVWTEGFGVYLKKLGQDSQINVVGPILWYLPEGEENFKGFGIKVAVFDITPVIDNKAVFGALKNYYSLPTISKFVADIVNICDEISATTGKQIQILLKHKRVPVSGRHDSSYIDYLEKLDREKAGFKMIDHNTNLFDLLEECDLSISVPYTSTAYVAATVKKPGIYYDSSAELLPKYEISEFVSFASGPLELKQLVESLLTTGKHVEKPAIT